MKSINHILVVSPDYPIEGDPSFEFVKNLCDEFVRQGRKVTVLSPHSKISEKRHGKIVRPLERTYMVDGHIITVYQPNRVSVPSRFIRLNNWIARQSANHFLRRQKIEADVCYCHFWRSGYMALPYVKAHHLPLFVATGEGALQGLKDRLGSPAYLEINKYLNAAISVSSNNRNISQQIGLLDGKDCLVAPNAIDSKLYFKKDKTVLRQKYGFGQDDFIVAFVGAFIDRKGPQRLSAAIDKVGSVKSFFIGGAIGELNVEPTCEGVLFKGKLPHEAIPDYLNMADIFVLPTLNEGCCNAIVEALACGLPVVSANRPFNFDVLNETNSIMVDPTDVNAIAEAIKELKENKDRRQQLAEGALKMAEGLTIDGRARRILDFMEQHI